MGAMPLKGQSQVLGKGLTQTGQENCHELLGVISFLCSQWEKLLISCRRPRSNSLI